MEAIYGVTTDKPFVFLLSLFFYGWWTFVGLWNLGKLIRGRYSAQSTEYVKSHRMMCESLAFGVGGLVLLVLSATLGLHLMWLGVASVVLFWCGLEAHLAWKARK